MIKPIKISFIILLFFTLLLGVVYPYFVFGVGQVFFHKKAMGSLIYNAQGEIIGSKLIGQNFSSSKYFHPRPSNAGSEGYDAASSSGSNLGPTSKELMSRISKKSKEYRSENNLDENTLVPADAVTSSASGLDPDISVQNALLQAPRIAKARKLSESAIVQLIQSQTKKPLFFTPGSSRVNVLEINLALDELNSKESSEI